MSVDGIEPDENGNVDLIGYATEQYLKEYAQPKGDYLTEHQDISGKLDASELPNAINAALAQAKESGEFDGKDGVDGYTPQKNVDYFDGKDGKDGFSPVANVNQTEDGAVITIIDKSGITTATITNGKDYVLTGPDKTEIAEQAAQMVEVPEVDLSGYAKTEDVPTKPEDIGAQPEGDYALRSEIPSVPVQSVNGKTGAVVLSASDVGARPDTWMPSANDVDADKSGTASSAVSTHNTKTDAHNDIRLLISGLTTRLDALANSDDDTLDQMAEVVAYIKANRDLIEQVTNGKVSVTDIVNNLTTNVTNKPLSAAQGVALKALIDALNDEKLDASALSTAINTALAQAKASGEFNGAAGPKGDKGDTGESGTSVTVKSVSESTADGGSNVVTFSDGKTLTVKNGKTGTDGKTPVKGTDYFTATDKAEMVNAVIAALPVYAGEVV